jgi:hypothetical protein
MSNAVQQPLRPITLQGNVLGSQKGVWSLDVEHTDSEGDLCVLLLNLRSRCLDQRRLILWLPQNALCVASSRELIAAAVREWIDSTEGDGKLDLRGSIVEE